MNAKEFAEFMDEHGQSRVVVEVPDTSVIGKSQPLPNRFIVMKAYKNYTKTHISIEYVELDSFKRHRFGGIPNDFVINPITDASAIADLQKYDEVVGSLEREFEALVKTNMPLIEAKLKEARKALNEAVKIAEANGIPFHSSVSGLSQSYKPKSFNDDKWGKLSKDFINGLTDAYIQEYQNGWQQSAIC